MAENKVKRENYITIQGFMLTDLKLKGNELLIYACIYGFSQAENQVFNGSLQYLADWTNSTKQGVIKCLKSLEEKQFIVKKENFINGVKFCEYYATKFNTPLNNVDGGIQQSLIPPIKQSLPNNIDNNKNNNKEINKESFSEEDLALWFSKVYEIYPRKVSKVKAKEMFERKLRGLDKETAYKKAIAIYRMLERQVEVWESEKREISYLPYPASWLNDNVENSPHFKKGRKR